MGAFALSNRTSALLGQNGVLITATGGDNVILFTLLSSNGGNGVEIGGDASGVQVAKSASASTSTAKPRPNRGHGVAITGNAHDNVIGGTPPPSSRPSARGT